MEDIFVDIEDDVDGNDAGRGAVTAASISAIADSDILIDVGSVVYSRGYSDDGVKIIRYDAHNRPITKPSDYVSFRYSRYDRYGSNKIVHNPVTTEFQKSQSLIDEICNSSKSDKDKRREVRLVVNRFIQYLRGENIRHRNLWRQLDTHSMFAPKQIW